MAGLLDLSNELLITVAKYITKPSDKLHFALLNKQSCGRLVPLIYEHIILDYTEYPIPKIPKQRINKYWAKPPPPCSNLVRLTETISSCHRSQGAFQHLINALTIKLEANNEGNEVQIAFTKVLSLLPHLTHLHFELLANDHSHRPEVFSFAPLARILAPLGGTLRSLTLYVAGKDKISTCGSDGWTIGSLRHFHALAALSIQMAALMGKEDNAIMTADLNDLLPPRLQKLELYWPIYSPRMFSGALRNWLLGEVQQPWTLEIITVHVGNEITPMDSVFWPDVEIIREQARFLGRDVDLKVDISQDCC